MTFKDLLSDPAVSSFLSGQGLTGDLIQTAVIALALAIVIGLAINRIYRFYFGGVVYSASFAVTLVGMTVLACTLTLAISSSIVISLGMVGALSIVRFRTAIKDPMDLLYLFWAISEGITLGAGLYVLAIVALLMMTIVIHVLYYRRVSGTIFILVTHYVGDEAGDEVLRALGGRTFQLKSKTVRDGVTEMTAEVLCTDGSSAFLERIDALEGVRDATLIQYNGEYNG